MNCNYCNEFENIYCVKCFNNLKNELNQYKSENEEKIKIIQVKVLDFMTRTANLENKIKDQNNYKEIILNLKEENFKIKKKYEESLLKCKQIFNEDI
mgnify:CR=1 FL=1|tara:strand:+ start:234 stop:524 length:291 start_codon:yes stop_codon:yes gene_type:complete